MSNINESLRRAKAYDAIVDWLESIVGPNVSKMGLQKFQRGFSMVEVMEEMPDDILALIAEFGTKEQKLQADNLLTERVLLVNEIEKT